MRSAGIGLAIAALSAGCTSGPQGAYLRQFVAAERASSPFEPITTHLPAATLAEAYAVQDRYVRRRVRAGDTVAGYKGGLMSAASLRSRGVSEPLVGVLFASDAVRDGAAVSLCSYRKASFELKLGYLLDDVSGPALRASVVPVIDLPDIAYRDPDHYGAVDMVAANVSAARYVRGAVRPIADVDLDAVRVTLRRDGAIVASGTGRESLDGQKRSLETVVDQVRKSGRTPKAGDLIVTGKIGDRGWLQPGDYAADYGVLGVVRFTVTPCGGRAERR
jgi:2-keto-4-pentenoate hydratase